jgi:membrane-bound ClpP family serine protease
MEVFFWCCFLTGVMFTLITLLFGELLSGWADSLAGHPIVFLQPVVWVGALTSFGGAGILLVRYAPFGAIFILLAAALLATALSMLVWFVYVTPMRRSQNSTGFSMNELVGKIGDVCVPIPERGFGEVIIKVGAGVTNQVAAGFDGVSIGSGQKVVVVHVKQDVLYVSLLEDQFTNF